MQLSPVKTERYGNWMQVASGGQFWPLDPRADEIFIEDIAQSLSKQCRYAGHCRGFYSVAEHSVYVSQVVPPEFALCGLLHDATEAYVVDVPRPLKYMLKEYKEIEDRVWVEVAKRFGLPEQMPAEVHLGDNAVLLAERGPLMDPTPAPWGIVGEPANITIQCLDHKAAYRLFMERFIELTENK